MVASFTAKEEAFIAQKELFVAKALESFGLATLQEVPDIIKRLPIPLPPVLIDDYRAIPAEIVSDLAEQYWGLNAVAHFIVLNPNDHGHRTHPLLEIAEQLSAELPLRYPVSHPMEGHQEAVSRFGPPDGTLKIYNLETRDGRSGYREQAETSEQFDAHNDGLGYAGAVESFILYADSGPLWGGYTYFQNLVHLSLHLARYDQDAFASLFLPDAITALRPRGKGAIEVTSPVLFLNEQEAPQVFFRIPTGEYKITWRSDCEDLNRASRFLGNHAKPFALGSTFASLDRKGFGCIARNGWLVHGRTCFINGDSPDEIRVLARKWFMTRPEHARYKHVPGMHIMQKYADLYPERFGADVLYGHWNYDAELGENVRKS